jgi:hypothetical protein
LPRQRREFRDRHRVVLRTEQVSAERFNDAKQLTEVVKRSTERGVDLPNQFHRGRLATAVHAKAHARLSPAMPVITSAIELNRTHVAGA